MRYRFFWRVVVLAVMVAVPAATLAAGTLVKSPTRAAVYYVGDDGVRHAFPNAATYSSWYGDDFSGVAVLGDDELGALPLGPNVPLKPGKWLAKVPSVPTVYAVEHGGVLRPIASATIAAAIYGPRWPGKIVDLPEVFFENYAVGEPLDRPYQLPNSIVYQVKGKPTYYWKQGNLLQPFANPAAMAANGYDKDDAVVSDRMLPTRSRAITGEVARLADPLASPERSTQDCGAAAITVAPILVARGELTPSYRDKLAVVREQLPTVYHAATQELGVLAVAEPVVLADDGLLSKATEKGGRTLTEEVPRAFYDLEPDAYDFLVLFTNFVVQQEQSNHEARHVMVTNAISGLGLPVQNAADLLGSRGKLKGVIVMGDLGRFALDEAADQQRLNNLLLHELGHQWSATVKFRTADDQDSVALLREDGRHWSYYAGFISPLGGSGWRDVGDGRFTSRLAAAPDLVVRPYSELDLYLMGLLPRPAVRPFTYLEPTSPGAQGNTLTGRLQTVTIEQVVAAMGPRRCELERPKT